MKKKIVSLFIIISLTLSLVPSFQLEAYAADESTVLEEVYEEDADEKYQLASEGKTNEEKIADAIKALRSYYFNSDKDFTFRVALGYIFTSDDLEQDLQIIQQRFKVNEEAANPSDYAGIIMGLIAAGKNPKAYNGKNYEELLIQSLDKDIWNVYPTTIAYSILALDMVKAEYDVKKAVDALLSYQGDDGGFDGGWGATVDDTAMCIMALAKHKDIKGVQDAITKGKKYIKDNQDENGGFVAWGAENPYSTSAAIQGLIAVGEDPLSEEWTTESGKTILDFLLGFMVDDHFKYNSDIDYITEQAFCALADLYRGKSMFHEIIIKDTVPSKVKISAPSDTKIKENSTLKLAALVYDDKDELLLGHSFIWESCNPNIAQVDSDGLVTAKSVDTITNVTITVRVKDYEHIFHTIELTVVPEEFKVTRTYTSEIKNGSEARLEFEIKENLGETRSATLIVVLYDKNTNKMVNYSYATKEFRPGESVKLGTGFLIPNSGKYVVRCFVWESFESQKVILANPIEIDVKQ